MVGKYGEFWFILPLLFAAVAIWRTGYLCRKKIEEA